MLGTPFLIPEIPMRHSTTLLALACAAVLAGCQPASTPQNEHTSTPAPAPAPVAEPAAPVVDAAQETHQRLEAIVAGEHRSDADRARDAYRHPVETLTFFGVTPGATVIEITPGAGWYADILAPFLRANGTYVAAIWDDTLPDQPEYYARLNTRLNEKFAAAPDVYGEPELRRFDPSAPIFGKPGSADVVLTFRNAHNWIGNGTAPAFFSAFHEVLKSGGILGVTDHRAKGDAATDGKSGYVTEEQIIGLAIGAGFRLVERSEINANPNDTADHPRGVWTLPPNFALGDEDREKYAAIGESDRMTLKFVKP
ncbi:methyltransferase [Xanthomonadaceae bacterium JHOS43]|nr:methyltransferase [Xanthomonadaceae bacterium JHOS43]